MELKDNLPLYTWMCNLGLSTLDESEPQLDVFVWHFGQQKKICEICCFVF